MDSKDTNNARGGFRDSAMRAAAQHGYDVYWKEAYSEVASENIRLKHEAARLRHSVRFWGVLAWLLIANSLVLSGLLYITTTATALAPLCAFLESLT